MTKSREYALLARFIGDCGISRIDGVLIIQSHVLESVFWLRFGRVDLFVLEGSGWNPQSSRIKTLTRTLGLRIDYW